MSKNLNNNLKKALGIIKDNIKKNPKKDKKENWATRLPKIAKFLDESEEKKKEFLRVVKEERDIETGDLILNKGIVVYARLLETVKILIELIKNEDIECYSITGSTSTKKRGEIEDWFHNNSSRKIVFISDAGGASLNLNPTNEIILYSIPSSYRKFKQVIGRVARSFGKFNSFNIRLIMVEESLDEYSKELLGSKSSLENELLHCDSIPLTDNKKYVRDIFKKIKKDILWRFKKKK